MHYRTKLGIPPTTYNIFRIIVEKKINCVIKFLEIEFPPAIEIVVLSLCLQPPLELRRDKKPSLSFTLGSIYNLDQVINWCGLA